MLPQRRLKDSMSSTQSFSALEIMLLFPVFFGCQDFGFVIFNAD